jgi:hypothetical protein
MVTLCYLYLKRNLFGSSFLTLKNMKAFLEKIGGEWLDDFVYISKYPLSDRGYTIVPFDGDDMENTLLNKHITLNDMCVGSVQATTKFFEIAGVQTPESITYPSELVDFLGREIKICELGSVNSGDLPLFIKPAIEIKKFTGDVFKSQSHLDGLRHFDGCNDQTVVWTSTLLEFETEYRVFVSKGVIYGMKHYQGDYAKIVDIEEVKKMVAAYKDCPSAYTLDVGLTENGETKLVEVNDMWAIGSYGLEGRDYALLCARRMKEIMSQNGI